MKTRLAVATLSACGIATAGLMTPAAGAPGSGSQASLSADVTALAAAQQTRTSFGLEHRAFGTKIGGNPALRSGPTANSVIGCTNLAGLVRQNSVAGVDLAPLVTGDEVLSRGTTTQNDGVVTVTSRNTITQGSLLGGDVQFRGLSSESRTYHNKSGFHNAFDLDLARLSIDGDRVRLTGGTQRLDVPGGTLTVFSRATTNNAEGASARGIVLRLALRDGTRVLVGSSFSRMRPQVFGPMRGSTWGSQVNVADGTVTSGRTAFQPMQCQGTRGIVRENATAGISIDGVVSTSDVVTHVYGTQKPNVQRGYTQAQIAQAELGALGITAEGIVSKAKVKRDSGRLTRSAQGTHLLELNVDGLNIRDQLNPGEPLRVVGLGTVTFKKVNQVRNGIEVVALEVVLSDDTVIELGHSIMRINKN